MKPLAISMGCPAGIGPEIIIKYFTESHSPSQYPAIVAGDIQVLQYYAAKIGKECTLLPWKTGTPVPGDNKTIAVYETSHLSRESIRPGIYSSETSCAMVAAITNSVQGIQNGLFSGICTCPISKEALQLSGYHYPGHTEMLADLTGSTEQVMMMAGKTLKVTLATIHCALKDVPGLLSEPSLCKLFAKTWKSLQIDFNITHPRIAIAALNPHAGEGGMFGNEEKRIIIPAILKTQKMGYHIQGPYPPDTVFIKAAAGEFDAVICMYHDQGLIPFKLLHFKDGVNVTIGLNIVRTSVDHGTAYDIAGKNIARPDSLIAAVQMAHTINVNRNIAGNQAN